MLAVVADMQRDIGGFLKTGRFSESDREGNLRFYTSRSIPHVVAAIGGFSGDEAAQSVGKLISHFRPKFLVSAGFASSVKSCLPVGGVVVCDRISAVGGPAYSWRTSDALKIEADPLVVDRIRLEMSNSDVKFDVGGCLTLPQSVVRSPMKEWLGKTFDVAAVDLDGYRVADAVRDARLQFILVRAVMDTVEQDLLPRVSETMRYPLARRIIRSSAYAIGNPVRIFEIAKSASQAGTARKSLSWFLYRLARTQLAMGED